MAPHSCNISGLASQLRKFTDPRQLVKSVRRINSQARRRSNGGFSPQSRRRRKRRRIGSAIEDLPLELLWIIFEELNTKGLSRVSKASKSLRWAVEPILYARISVRPRPSSHSYDQTPREKIRLLLKTLVHRPELGERIRHLLLPDFPCPWNAQPGATQSLYQVLLSRVPRLQRLNLRWGVNPLQLFRSSSDNGVSALYSISRDVSPVVFPHGFEFLKDLTIGPDPNRVEEHHEELEDLVPLLYLPSLKTLILDSFGLIWTHANYRLPCVSSGIKVLKLMNTTMSEYPDMNKGVSKFDFYGRQSQRWSKFRPALKPFVSCIKSLQEFSWEFDPAERMGDRVCDVAELLSDLQCHAHSLKRLIIDMGTQWEEGLGRHRIESLKDFTQLSSLRLPFFVLLETFYDFDPIDNIPAFLPPNLQELVICPTGARLAPAVRLAVWLEVKRRFEDFFHEPEKLWIGFRTKRYGGFFDKRYFSDEDWLELIAPIPYGDEDDFSFKSLDLTVALRDVPGTSFRDFMGHYMKMYHDHFTKARETQEE
ncbi:hypothetical protein IWZ00DRAFT_22661 [Phyllosticta capitalensis]|uniref:F-box domain-containing protein n=1 Tax=Phyllosticta capitalensis TaxID=121624 RepID=A0ABR1Z3N1_9PEZI